MVSQEESDTGDEASDEMDEDNDETSDDSEDQTAVNMPPGSFELIGVMNGMAEVALSPSFEWNESIDPDGDVVTYTFVLDENEAPSTVIATDLSSTEYIFDTRLDFSTQYYWKIIAQDTEGNSSESQVFSFTTRKIGTRLSTADFSQRHLATVTEFDGKLFLVGGFGVTDSGNRYLSDVWSSSDGETWTLETDNPGFVPRAFHQVVIFEQKLFLIGGFRAIGGPSNDIWTSTNGKDWTLETENAQFPADWGHKVLSYDNQLWLITGGQNEFFNRNVWKSADGINWQLVVDDIGFEVSLEQEAIVYNDKMWVINNGLVHSSTDGVTWDVELENAPFESLFAEYSLAIKDDTLYLMVSESNNATSAQIWISSDGSNWELLHEETAFPNRADNGFIGFGDELYILFGLTEDGFENDVWRLD